jgi:predicted TIM-barrel enzyme
MCTSSTARTPSPPTARSPNWPATWSSSTPTPPVLVGSGVTPDNVGDILSVANGVIVASWLKRDGVWWNPVDPDRLATFMAEVARIR